MHYVTLFNLWCVINSIWARLTLNPTQLDRETAYIWALTDTQIISNFT